MANTNAPFGLRPLMRSIAGGPAAVVPAHKLVGYGTALFIGDAVTRVASGTKTTMAISAAITPGTTPAFGVNLIYGAASTATDHLIIPGHNGQVFEIQEDGTANTNAGIAAADLNKNANLVLTAGNTGTKISKHQLAGSTIATTNTLDLHIVGFTRDPNNTVAAQYARVEVIFNNSQLANQIAGI